MKKINEYIKEADKAFSLYIRKKYANAEGYVRCFTCPATGHWKEFDCGHFISRKHMSVRWNQNNARPQCKYCNQAKYGMENVFQLRLTREIGIEKVEKLLQKKHETFKLDRQTLIDLKNGYNEAQKQS